MGSVDGGGDGKPVAVRMGGDMVGGFAMVITGSSSGMSISWCKVCYFGFHRDMRSSQPSAW